MSMPTSGSHTAQVCSGLTPEQWKAIPNQWPSPYVGVTGADATVVKSDIVEVKAGQRRPSSGSTDGSTTFQDPTVNLPSQGPTLYHCPTTGFGGRVFGHRTLMNVIDMTGGGTNLYTLGRYMVAALLNARSGRTPVLDESGVRNMWNDLVNRGYYEPTAGIRWTATDIVTYLRTTMG